VAAAVAGCAAVAWLAVATRPPRYQAAAGLKAATLWDAPVDAAAWGNLDRALRSASGWAEALQAEGIDPGTAPPVGEAVSLSAAAPDNALTLRVTLSDPDKVVAVANRLSRAGVDRVADLRARAQEAAGSAAAPELEPVRAQFDAASAALGDFVAQHGIRWIDGEPYGAGGRVLTPDIRRKLETLRGEQTIALSLYTQARAWVLDQRRQAINRIPPVILLDAAAPPAAHIGPRPLRAAALAGLVGGMAALGLVVVWELFRRVRSGRASFARNGL
jgi:uncharacterized protein involved in exopolysaccharide biosynthesis